MGMKKRTLHTAACLLSILLSVSGIGGCQASAQIADVDHGPGPCTVTGLIGDRYPAGSNFTVRVFFRDQPISGVKVVLNGETVLPNRIEAGVVATADTDSEGVAHFSAIRPGIYQAHIDQGLLAPSQEIEVEANGSSVGEPREVPIEWPWAPSVTRGVRGWITSWQKDSPQNRSERRPFANALVQLLDLRSGKLLAGTHTDAAGYYEFDISRHGLYVVRVSEAQDPSGTAYDKAVEVALWAIRDSMPRLEVDHVCGGGLVELPDELPDGTDPQDALVTVAQRRSR